ncbi:MAG: hypothetical protein JKY37_01235 [Nannocystaceae bacterium]|nr:hypothetical protein [Nannocystaceae bacterium]
MFGLLTSLALAALITLAPTDDDAVTHREFERLQGYSTVVLNHVSDRLGTDNLPNAAGLPVEPGIFVTVLLDRLQIYDRDIVGLNAGRLDQAVAAHECVSGCALTFYDAFQETWLEAAIESSVHAVEIPQRVLFAAHEQVPARSVVDLAYAAAETRPVQPPSLHLLVNSANGGLRAMRFYLIPPGGLDLRQGSAALGLTISISRGKYVVKATDPRFAREHSVGTLAELRRLLADVKRRYPGKESAIIVPDAQVSVGELMAALTVVRPGFPRIVLSAGQRVRTP